MTRDEQLAAAREIARLNPEWRQFPLADAFQHTGPDGGGAWIRFGGSTWTAYRSAGWGELLRGEAFRTRTFRSPAAAIRALGFDLLT
jgi:hypothetical protein